MAVASVRISQQVESHITFWLNMKSLKGKWLSIVVPLTIRTVRICWFGLLFFQCVSLCICGLDVAYC